MIIMLAFACSSSPGGYVLLPGPPYVISISGNGVNEVFEIDSDTDTDTGTRPNGGGSAIVWNLSGSGCTQNIWPVLTHNPAFPLPVPGASLPVGDTTIYLARSVITDTDTDTDIVTTIGASRWLTLEGASVQTTTIEHRHWSFLVHSTRLCTPEGHCTDNPEPPLAIDIRGPQVDVHERLETGTPGYYWEVVPSPTWFDPDGVPYCALTYFTP